MNNDDDDMATMMDGLSMDDIGSQHYQWTIDDDPLDDLSYSFIVAYEQHSKTTNDNKNDDDDDEDTLFLNNWEVQDIGQRVDVDSIINNNPMGLVAIDANQPSSLQPQLISIDQQLLPSPAKGKQKKALKRAPSSSIPRPSASSSKTQQAKTTGKKPKTKRLLQPKNPNV